MVILEAVASQDHGLWHVFFGVAGSNNDINVLNQSDLFVEHPGDEAPKVHYYVNGRQYNNGYYLADGIYLEWLVFFKSIREPQSDKHKLLHKGKKGQGRMLNAPLAFCNLTFVFCVDQHVYTSKGDLENIMLACIILHNMIIKDEKGIEKVPLDLNEEASTYTFQAATISHGQNLEMEDVLQRNAIIHDR